MASLQMTHPKKVFTFFSGQTTKPTFSYKEKKKK